MEGRGVSFHAYLVLGMAWSLKDRLTARRCIDTGLLKSPPGEVAQRGTGIHTVSGKNCPTDEMSNLLLYLLARLVATGLR